MAVDPDLAVAVHAVEIDEHQPPAVRHRHGEGLAVPSDAAWQRTAGDAGRARVAELTLDAPVMRHVERSPGRIGETHRLGAGNVAEMESPIPIEVEHRSLPIQWEREAGDSQREEGDEAAGHPRKYR